MSLVIGTQLMSYEITSLLGKGGMGEVYRARDTKLKREVAIKILPDEYTRDLDRISRFQREAELLASLNHPNIAAIYDLQEANGSRFLVLELVNGDTLADRLQRGPVPIDEALRIANYICEALEAAHEKGVIHRDLKPGNVKITPDGNVKVLDFGLAKALDNSPANVTMSNSPTLTVAGTNAGVILGTAAYMSPEQARGRAADQRSDVFSFGCVLYEMLTGRQAFHAEEVSDVLASVLKSERDFGLLPARLNPRIHEVLRRCFQKNPNLRWHAIADTRIEIEAVLADPRGVVVDESAVAALKRPLWKRAIPILGSSIIFSVLAAIAAWTLKPSAPGIVTRFELTLPEDAGITGAGQRLIAISPDATKLVYVSGRQLFLRQMGEMEASPISGTGAGNSGSPFFSPDGQWVGFYSPADSALKKVPITGGAAITICKSSAPFGVSWAADHIIFAENGKGIMRVSADGGEPETLVSINREEGTAYGPQMIDGGKAILFTLADATGGLDRWDRAQMIVHSLASKERRVVFHGGSDAHYVPTGHIVYALGQNLMALPFDLKKLQPKGGSIPLVQGVMRPVSGPNQTGVAQFAFANNGTLIYIPARTDIELSRTVLALVDRATGKSEVLPLPETSYSFPQISPDGKKVAVTTNDGQQSVISIYELSGGATLRRLTFGGSNSNPVWSRPDGRYVIFTSDRDGNKRLFRQREDGIGQAEPLTMGEKDAVPLAESVDPSGKVLAFTIRRGENGSGAIWLLPLEGDRKATLFSDERNGAGVGSQAHAAFSPDGRWLAYTSNEERGTGPRVFVRSYPTGSKYQITMESGIYPLWSPTGKQQLFYMWDKLYAVDIRTETSFSAGKPSTLPFAGIIQRPRSQRNYDITPDGKQFLVVLPASAQEQTNLSFRPPQINVVLNWFRELQERVPAK